MALIGGKCLFQRKIKYSHEISKLCNFLSENNKKKLPLRYKMLFIPELLVNFFIFIVRTPVL